MSKIKELIDSVEIYKMVFDILTTTKNRYDELSLILSDFKKDIDRIHVKLTELENIKLELNGVKVKQEESSETLRKDIGRKLEALNKLILDLNEQTKPTPEIETLPKVKKVKKLEKTKKGQ